MEFESHTRTLARGQYSQVELTTGRTLLISSGTVTIALAPEEYMDLCGTLLHGLQNYKSLPRGD